MFNFLQWLGITDVRRRAAQAGRAASRAEMSVQELQVAVERLQLGATAMWEVLREQTGLTDEDLAQRITELDLRDGKLDGKIAATRRHCASCGRDNAPRRLRCLYCGDELPPTSALQP